MAIGNALDNSFSKLFRQTLKSGEGKLLVGVQRGDVQLLRSVDKAGLQNLLAGGEKQAGKNAGVIVQAGDRFRYSPEAHLWLPEHGVEPKPTHVPGKPVGPKPPAAKRQPKSPARKRAPQGAGKTPAPAKPAAPVVTHAGAILLTPRAAGVFADLGVSKTAGRKLLEQAEAVRSHALAGGKTEAEAFAEAEGFLKQQLPKASGKQLNILREAISPTEQGKMQRFIGAAKQWRKQHPNGAPAPAKPKAKPHAAKKPAPATKPHEAKKPAAAHKTHRATPAVKPRPASPVKKQPAVVPAGELAKNKTIFVFVSGAVQAIKKTLDGLVEGLRKLLKL